MKIINSLLLSVLLSVTTADATSPRLGSSGGNSQQQHGRNLFFCMFGGCDEDQAQEASEFSLFGSFCMPLFGQCAGTNTDDLDYTDCQNRTDGFFGGRPVFGSCGYVTEVVDSFIGSTDTDGDGMTDTYVVGGTVDADGVVQNATVVPGSWLQIFPEDSLVWDIFGPTEGKYDQSVIDRAIHVIFGEQEFGKIVIAPFALDWYPTYGNETCLPDAADVATTTTPTCMTPLGSDGFYVCRTLYNPYTAAPDSKTVCIDYDDTLLVGNDKCGCCGGICPEEIVDTECTCRCDLNGINDGLAISSAGFGDRCVTKEYGVATIGQLDVKCSDACATDTGLGI